MRKNLSEYLTKHPDCAVYDHQDLPPNFLEQNPDYLVNQGTAFVQPNTTTSPVQPSYGWSAQYATSKLEVVLDLAVYDLTFNLSVSRRPRRAGCVVGK
jgi:hypothetical protein